MVVLPCRCSCRLALLRLWISACSRQWTRQHLRHKGRVRVKPRCRLQQAASAGSTWGTRLALCCGLQTEGALLCTLDTAVDLRARDKAGSQCSCASRKYKGKNISCEPASTRQACAWPTYTYTQTLLAQNHSAHTHTKSPSSCPITTPPHQTNSPSCSGPSCIAAASQSPAPPSHCPTADCLQP